MAIDRAAIFDALYQRIAKAYPWVDARRAYYTFDRVNKPCVCFIEAEENPIYQGMGFPTQWSLDVLVLIYVVANDNEDISWTRDLDVMISAVESALDFDSELDDVFPGAANSATTTLGGLCAYCRIEGQIWKEHPFSSQYAAAGITIRIHAPSAMGIAS